LVDFILHRAEDEVGVGRGVGEDGGEEGEALEVEDLWLERISWRQEEGKVQTGWVRGVGEDGEKVRTMSFLLYDRGNTSLALAVLTSKLGMMATALISLAQLKRR
jgi:hypothetical protein